MQAAMFQSSTRFDPWPEDRAMGAPNEYPSGTVLFRQGDRVKALYLVTRGIVKLVRAEATGRDVLIGLRTSGWLVGSAACILGVPHPVTAETLGTCVLRQVSNADFIVLSRESPVSQWIERMQARETYEHVMLLGQFGAMSPRERLERILSMLAEAGGERRDDGCIRLTIALKQHELGQAIGVTREHASRLLAQLQRDGVIRRERGWLLIPPGSALVRNTVVVRFRQQVIGITRQCD